MVGYYYDETLSANLSGVTWSVYSGSLPYGLSLSSSGEIYGTPTYYGTYDFTVQARGTYSSTTKDFTIIVYDYGYDDPYYDDPYYDDAGESSGGGGCDSGIGLAGLILLAGLVLRKSHR